MVKGLYGTKSTRKNCFFINWKSGVNNVQNCWQDQSKHERCRILVFLWARLILRNPTFVGQTHVFRQPPSPKQWHPLVWWRCPDVVFSSVTFRFSYTSRQVNFFAVLRVKFHGGLNGIEERQFGAGWVLWKRNSVWVNKQEMWERGLNVWVFSSDKNCHSVFHVSGFVSICREIITGRWFVSRAADFPGRNSDFFGSLDEKQLECCFLGEIYCFFFLVCSIWHLWAMDFTCPDWRPWSTSRGTRWKLR